jgi:hypothetical protein
MRWRCFKFVIFILLIISCTNRVVAEVTASQAEEIAKRSFLGNKANASLEYIHADRKLEIEESLIDLQLAASKNNFQKYYFIFEVENGGCGEIETNQYKCKYPIGGTPFSRFAISKSTGKVYEITSLEDKIFNDFIKELGLELNNNGKRKQYYHSIALINQAEEIALVLNLFHLKSLLEESLSWHFQLSKAQKYIAYINDKEVNKWINKWISTFLSEKKKVDFGIKMETQETSFVVRRTVFTGGNQPCLWQYMIQIASDGRIEDYDKEQIFCPATGAKDWETFKDNKFRLPEAHYEGLDDLPFLFWEEKSK